MTWELGALTASVVLFAASGITAEITYSQWREARQCRDDARFMLNQSRELLSKAHLLLIKAGR